MDSNGNKVYHKNIPCTPENLLRAIAPFREGLVVGVECIFCWYWLADLCDQEGIDFVLGHALYMKSIHGVKTRLLRGGNFPVAYVYPPDAGDKKPDASPEPSRQLSGRAELLSHIQNTTTQYNLAPLGTLSRPHHRRDKDIVGHFLPTGVGMVQLIVETDLKLIDHYDPIIKELDKQIRL